MGTDKEQSGNSDEKLKKNVIENMHKIHEVFQDTEEKNISTSNNKNENRNINKTKFSDILIATIFIGAILFISGWAVLQEVKYNSQEKNFFWLFAMLIIIYFGFIAIKSLDLNSNLEKILFFTQSDGKFLTNIFLLILGIPILLLLLPILFFILSNLYWLLSIYLIATCILFVKMTRKYIFKAIAILILASLLFAGFKSRKILKINMKVVFDNEIISQ
jgi:F0F1-type ATP synthase assembly protein I